MTLETIDAAIRSLEVGLMRRFTDVATESLRLDLHASGLWQKRGNRLAALPWRVKPASGDGIERQRAEDYAGFVREQLEAMPSFRQVLIDLNNGTFHGRATSEIEWDLNRGRWRVVDAHWIHARRLSFGPNRDLRIIDINREIADFRDEGFALERIPYKFIPYKPRIFGDYAEREGLALRSTFWSFFGRVMQRERLHLIEIFGKPWRVGIVKRDPKNPTQINQDQIDDAFDSLNRLGGHSTAVLPLEMELMIAQPQRGAGEIHGDAIEHCEKAQSKLFVGGTATTDAVSTGLGSNIGNVHMTEEDLIIASDAWRLSEVVERYLTDAIIVVNFGPDAVSHAPEFEIATDPPLDREKEAELLTKTLEAGVEVSVREARERLGVEELQEGEPYLRRTYRNLNGQAAPQPTIEIVYPSGMPVDPGQIRDVPTVPGAIPIGDRPAPGAGVPGFGAGGPAPGPAAPELGGPSEEPPDFDDVLTGDETVAELAEKMTAHRIERCPHNHNTRCRRCGIERVQDFELGEDEQPLRDEDGAIVWKVIWRPIPAGTLRALAMPRLDGIEADGGVHVHGLDAEREQAVLGGAHRHSFRLPGGQIINTEMGGAHAHAVDEDWCWGGKHAHFIVLPMGTRLRTEVDGEHSHDLLMSRTTESGKHVHSLVLPDGTTLDSLTPHDVEEVQEQLGIKGFGGALAAHGAEVCFAEQPSTVFGSPDVLMKRGVTAAARAMKDFADRIARAVDGKASARTIREALSGIKNPSRLKLREALRRELLMGLMLGALDSAYETEEGALIQVEAFGIRRATWKLIETDPKFVEHPMSEAVRVFESRKIVTPRVFKRLDSLAKQRAFTIAGLADEELLRTARAELSARVRDGADLRTFRTFVTDRLESAGWTPANSSHVETIFRNNVQSAYAGGRWRQMTQEAVAEAFPYLQIVTVNDGPPRQRENHQATHLAVFRKDDPAFPGALPPWDHNCRCRFRSMSERQLGTRSVLEGSWLATQRLPAPGFGGGASSFL